MQVVFTVLALIPMTLVAFGWVAIVQGYAASKRQLKR
jgi:hypothetical protein